MKTNKLFRGYMLLGIAYHLFTIFFLQRFANNNYLTQGFTDLYYVYPFAIYYLIGVNLINKTYNYMFAVRHKKKCVLVLGHGLECALLAFTQVSFAYLAIIVYYYLFGSYFKPPALEEFVFIYFLFVLGTILIGWLTLIFRYSGIRFMRNYAEFFVYAVLIIELLAVIPRLRLDLGINIKILFAWIMYDRTCVNMVVLGIINAVVFICLFFLSKRRDLN